MTLPLMTKLDPGFDIDVIGSQEYQHWTVADLIEMLSEHEPTAKVWCSGDADINDVFPVRPFELISGDREHVLIG